MDREPWPLHFKHSCWWKTRSQSKFASHYAWGTNKSSMWIARWMYSLHGFLRGIEWVMVHSSLDYFQKPPLGGRPNTKTGDHGTLKAHNRWSILFYHVWGCAWNEIQWNSIWLRSGPTWPHITLEDPWPHYTILEVSWDGLWTLCFGLSQFHGHSYWLMCDVALTLCVCVCATLRSYAMQVPLPLEFNFYWWKFNRLFGHYKT